MFEFEVEIDVDGVLADMDGSYGKYIKDIIPDFSEETHILSWNMLEVQRDYPEAHKRVVALYSDYNFIRTLPRYKGIEEGLRKLYEIITPLGGKIVVHTHMKGEQCSKAREEWLEDLKRDTGVDFEIDICKGEIKNMRSNSLFLIEDNVRNCEVSNAKYKLLVRRGHNRSFTEEDLGTCTGSCVVDSFLESVNMIESILKR